MDKELLETLSNLFDEKLKPVMESQARLEKKLDAVVEQTADLTEFRTETKESLNKIIVEVEEIKSDLNNVEVITASNWKDIAKLKAVK
jgi:DNA topoisomerase IA